MTDTEIMRRGPATVSLSDEAGVNRFLVGAVGGLWSTVNDLTRLRPTRRERREHRGAALGEVAFASVCLRAAVVDSPVAAQGVAMRRNRPL